MFTCVLRNSCFFTIWGSSRKQNFPPNEILQSHLRTHRTHLLDNTDAGGYQAVRERQGEAGRVWERKGEPGRGRKKQGEAGRRRVKLGERRRGRERKGEAEAGCCGWLPTA